MASDPPGKADTMKQTRHRYSDEVNEVRPGSSAAVSDGGRITAGRGTVMVSGRVADDDDRKEAVRRVRGSGSYEVVQRIEVAEPEEEEVCDTMTAAAAGEALLPYLNLADDQVSIRVQQGWVELEGEVESYQLRQTLDRVLRELCGVKGLTNSLNVRSSVSVEQLKTQVSQALDRVTRASAPL